MGRIWTQIVFYVAGFFAAYMLMVIGISFILLCFWAAMILAGTWDLEGGLSCRFISYRGMYEDEAYFCGSLLCVLLPTYQVLGDVRHHHDTRMHQRFLHGDPSWTMSYSHLLVKERTAQSCDGDRIWNVLLNDTNFFPAEHWLTLLFDRTLGFPGEGPKWAIVSANVDSFTTNVNCLHWEADAFCCKRLVLPIQT